MKIAFLGPLTLAVLTVTTASCTPSHPPAEAQTSSVRSPIGGACTTDASCEDGASCDHDDPGGECTKKCATSADCGAGNVCRPDEKECFQGCKSQTDCKRAGYRCMGAAPEMFCDIPEENEKH